MKKRSPLVRQELAVQRHHHPVPGRVFLAGHVHPEVDRAHDPVAEFLVDEFLDRRPVDLEHLVEPVDGRVGRHRAVQRPAGRLQLQRHLRVLVQFEQRPRGRRFGLAHRVLAQQRGRGPRHRPPDRLGDRGPGQPQPHLGRPDGRGRLLLGHNGPVVGHRRPLSQYRIAISRPSCPVCGGAGSPPAAPAGVPPPGPGTPPPPRAAPPPRPPPRPPPPPPRPRAPPPGPPPRPGRPARPAPPRPAPTAAAPGRRGGSSARAAVPPPSRRTTVPDAPRTAAATRARGNPPPPAAWLAVPRPAR